MHEPRPALCAIFRHVGAAVIIALIVAHSATADEPAGFSDRLELRAMLLRGDFGALDGALAAHQEAFERRETGERYVAHAFGAFATSDPRLKKPLDAWVDALPGSYAARVARAVYGMHLARLTLPARPPDPEDPQYAPMIKLASDAQTDLQRAIEINPELTIAYALLIDAQLALGEHEQIKATRDAAFARYFESALVHSAYLESLAPAYGGTEELMRKYVFRVLHQFRDNPEIGPLIHYTSLLRAREALRHDDYPTAADAFDSLGGIDGFRLYTLPLAAALVGDRKFKDARERIERLLEIWPQDAEAYRLLALAHAGEERAGEALAASARAVELDPFNPEILLVHARLLANRERWEEALPHLENALNFGFENIEIQLLLGKAYLYARGDGERAVPALVRGVKSDPRDPENWWSLAEALKLTGDCRYPQTLAVYLTICTALELCTPAETRELADDAVAFSGEHRCEGTI